MIQSKLNPWKSEILKFWGEPRIQKSLSINIAKRTLSIDQKKTYKIPVFFELTDEFDTAALYGFNGTLEQHLKKMDPAKKFVLIGECRHIRTIEKRISKKEGVPMAKDGFCIITGNANVTGNADEYIYKEKLERNIRYGLSDLQRILGMDNSSLAMHKRD